MFRSSFTLLTLVIALGTTQQQGGCPDRNGRYPDPRQCDAYLECLDGVPSQKLCPDGLLFNPNASYFSYPCQYPIEVDCQGRTATQAAQPTEECPHQFGYYRLGDENNCGQFMNCANGRAYIFDCPEGLAFNEDILKCDWPDQVRTCNPEAFLGFTCPNTYSNELGYAAYTYYRSPTTCQKYFICIEDRPRLFNCGQNNAFDLETNSCQPAYNVTGCSAESGYSSGFI